MFDHMGYTVRDFQRSAAFYEAALTALGMKPIAAGDGWAVFGSDTDEPFFWMGATQPKFWSADHHAGGAPIHVAFRAKDRAAVEAFHAAAIGAGGVDNGAPGVRQGVARYYAAFVLDPDGNNVEACTREKT